MYQEIPVNLEIMNPQNDKIRSERNSPRLLKTQEIRQPLLANIKNNDFKMENNAINQNQV